MEKELERLQRNSESLKVEMNEVREKLSGTERELQTEKNGHINTQRLLKRLWVDLQNTKPDIQKPKEVIESLKVSFYFLEA